MKDHRRVVACGAVSTYDAEGLPYGVRGLPMIISRRVTLRGSLGIGGPQWSIRKEFDSRK